VIKSFFFTYIFNLNRLNLLLITRWHSRAHLIYLIQTSLLLNLLFQGNEFGISAVTGHAHWEPKVRGAWFRERERSIFFLSDLNVGRMPGLLLLVRENNTRSPKVTLNWSRRQARSAWFLKYYCIMLFLLSWVGCMHDLETTFFC
jgi:hypothetical protein